MITWFINPISITDLSERGEQGALQTLEADFVVFFRFFTHLSGRNILHMMVSLIGQRDIHTNDI